MTARSDKKSSHAVPANRQITGNTQHAHRPGLALLLTIIVLAILSTAVYTLSSRLSSHIHRQQYIIDYQTARYACDSAMKYAFVTVEQTPIKINSRNDESTLFDFSDLYRLDSELYDQLRIDMAYEEAELSEESEDGKKTTQPKNESGGLLDSLKGLLGGLDDFISDDPGYIDPNTIIVEGPYGPEWPNVIEPIEIEIGDATVTITIEDENAKLPLTWSMMPNKELARQAEEGFLNFCDSMLMDLSDIEMIQSQIEEIKTKKIFHMNMKAIPLRPTSSSRTRTAVRPTSRTSRTSTTSAARAKAAAAARAKATSKNLRPELAHFTDFSRLMHASIIDLETLARPLPDNGSRYESPLKYLGIWGTRKVNINTAPRHVLEAAFAFGGDYVAIADEIILRRRIKPYKNLKELESELYGYSDSIKKVKPYITTYSTIFSIKVTATSGNASASSIATVEKKGTKATKIAVISD